MTYETRATIEDAGNLRLAGLPFAPGTEVDVIICPKRRSAEEFAAEWQHVCRQLRGQAPNVSDEDIRKEVDEYRAGR
jgi:hypothetical protein